MNNKQFQQFTEHLRQTCIAVEDDRSNGFTHDNIVFSVNRYTHEHISWIDIEIDLLELNDDNLGTAVSNAMHVNQHVFPQSPMPVYFAVREDSNTMQLVLHQRVYGETIDIYELFAQFNALKEQMNVHTHTQFQE